ncbi:UvrD-helicase domain-containing protein [Kroppenstedtia eburnea]|uniref:UvrD-helicase domain-containing protein n=1 Tax=Kroppenstedtia eburnea TaxID=714067 RepID=UPI00020C92A3|nr:UvrD/REP helicase subfamily [Desmospora sp. 8437]
MTTTAALSDAARSFFLRSAKAWQNYFDAVGLLPGIDPSIEQKAVIQQEEDQLLINGSAGSGKSITLMYKLMKVMEREQERHRILYVTFNRTLLDDTRKRMEQSERFLELKERHDLHLETFHQMAYRLLKEMGVKDIRPFYTSLDSIQNHQAKIRARIIAVRDSFMESESYHRLPDAEKLYKTHTAAFFYEEFMWMKANGYVKREDYLEVERTGRSQTPRLTKAQRKTVFTLFEDYRKMMRTKYKDDGYDMEDYALLLLGYMDQLPDSLCYDYVFVDEVQDLQPMQILALARLRKKGIVLTGDPKQRIYRSTPHSYASLGLNLQGRRNRTLRQNFRSTRQIMALANSIRFDDTEHDREDNQVYVKEGPKPEIRYFPKLAVLAQWLTEAIQAIHRRDPEATLAVIHRYDDELNRGLPLPLQSFLERNFSLVTTRDYHKKFDPAAFRKPIFFTDVASVKGLEFDYVFIVHFDRDHYPLKSRLKDLRERSNDPSSEAFQKDENAILNDEKKWLYVAITRAKKEVRLLYSAEKALRISQFIRDFDTEDYVAVGFDKRIYGK